MNQLGALSVCFVLLRLSCLWNDSVNIDRLESLVLEAGLG